MTLRVLENGSDARPIAGNESNIKQVHADMSSIVGNSPNFMENASKLEDRSVSTTSGKGVIKESIEALSKKDNVPEGGNASMNVDDRIQLCVKNDINIANAMANAANRNESIMGHFVSFADAKKCLQKTFSSISDTLNELDKSLASSGEKEIKDKSPEQKLLGSITSMLGRYIPGESIGSLSDDPANFTLGEGGKKRHSLCSTKKEIDDMLKGVGGPYTVAECIEKIKTLMGPDEGPGLVAILNKQKPAEPLKASDQPNEADTMKNGANKTKETVQDIALQRKQDFQTIQILCGTNDLAQTLNETKNDKFAGDLLKKLNEIELENETKTKLNIGTQLKTVGKLRENDFFYEYSWKDLDESIADSLASFFPEGEERKTMKSLIKADLLNSRKATGSAFDIKSGMRGRTVAKDLSNKIADRGTPEENFYCLSYDDSSDNNKKAFGVQFTETTKDLVKAMQENNAFDHSFRPGQFANGNMIDSKRLEIINDPIGYINKLQNTLDIFQGATFNEIPKFAEELLECCGENEDLSKDFENIIKEHKEICDITDGSKKGSEKEALTHKYLGVFCKFQKKYETKPQISAKDSDGTVITEKILNHPISKDGDKTISDLVKENTNNSGYESKSNLAAAMQNQGLRTICSVSGTTTDIVAATWAINKEKTETALIQLNKFTEEGCKDFSKLGNEFKDLFLSIALYMQSGQYHSAAEVLSGLCCSAQTLIEPSKTTIAIQNGRPEPYSTLMEAFQKNPTGFFPNSGEKSNTDPNQAIV